METETTRDAKSVFECEPYTGPHHDFDEIGQAYLKRAKKRAALANWVRNCPKELRRSDFKRYDLTLYFQQIQKILSWEHGRLGVIASGPSGRAKTRSMYALMLKLAKQGREIRYYSAFDFFGEMQSQVNYGRDNAGDWVKAVARVPIVFIDDLGQEAVQASKQEWAQGWFFRFLDLRSGNGLPLFVTTNLTSKQIADGSSDVKAHPLLRRLMLVCEPVKFYV